MRLDQLPRSDKVEDRRAERPWSGGGAGLGMGTFVVRLLVSWERGINPLYLIGGAEVLSRLGGSQEQSQPQSRKTEGPSDQTREFVSAVLRSSEVQWKEIFARSGLVYQAPSLVMFDGGTSKSGYLVAGIR